VAKTPQVLIVNEDLDSRVETRKALQRARLDIAGEVGLGAQAVAFASDTKPDVILISLEEPVTRALDTAETLGNVLPQTPLIFYSTMSDLETVRLAMAAGARDFLTKPVQAARFQQAIERALEFEEKRQMREAGQLASSPVRGTVVTVTGAKGGIGKSIVAVNLALALQQSLNGKVVIVDADVHFGDVATMLDIKPDVTISNLLSSLDEIDRWKITDYLTHTPQGLEVLATPSDDGDAWYEHEPESIKPILDVLSQNYDFVIVDTSGSFDRFVKAAVENSTLILVVTTGEVSSVRDTKSAMLRLEKWGIPREKVKLVLNRGVRAEGIRASDVEESVGRPVFWDLPRDSAVPRSVQLGRPVVLDGAKSPVARSIYTLARAIGGTLTEYETPASKPSGFGLRFLTEALKKR
jgi:pilus assembly protein CpaE